MGGAGERGRFDWLVELGGAIAPAAATAFAAFRLAPLIGLPATALAPAAGLILFALALLAMRAVAPEPRHHAIAAFVVEPIDAPGELLLDQPCQAPLDEMAEPEDDALLLEDVLGSPDPDSRVVRLFAPGSMPTAGQLKDRIDRHLAGTPWSPPEAIPDASDALYEALAELRRSLQ